MKGVICLMLKKWHFVTVAIIAIVVLTGCQSKNLPPKPKFLNKQECKKNIKKLLVNLSYLQVLFSQKKARTTSEKNVTYEEGVGTSKAQSYWIYAWQVEWLEQRNKNPQRAAKALAVLKNEVPKSEYMTKILDEAGRRMFAEDLKKAELGDPSGFQRDITVNPVKLLRK